MSSVEIPKGFEVINHPDRDFAIERVDKPSRATTRANAAMMDNDKLMRWKKELSSKQISNILAVVEEFGLDYIYGNSLTPLAGAL